MEWRGLELCCPLCKGELREMGDREPELHCRACDRVYPVILGIPDFRIFADPYIELEADRAKGRRLAERFDDLDFEGLVRFYYSISPANTPRQAASFTRGHLAAVPRAAASLDAWEPAAREGAPLAASLLELGCGTAPLVVAASPRYREVVGVDIAFRWLVVGKKRLLEAGVDAPIIAACAEALPLPDARFDRVVSDSTFENVRDARRAMAEARRVSRPGARLFVAMQNRFSLGPDPQTGLWGVGYLPRRVVGAHMRRQHGLPPQRELMSGAALRRRLREARFTSPHLALPSFPAGQRAHFTPAMRRVVDVYHAAARLPVSRQLL
ncbi:MAG TPA: methyltransferase domain-containing protein, partial [Gemmatimonadaceae bacterium]|nr:methyltransferase domain-containing protein [Gemmatimonadaceae bacterium]